MGGVPLAVIRLSPRGGGRGPGLVRWPAGAVWPRPPAAGPPPARHRHRPPPASRPRRLGGDRFGPVRRRRGRSFPPGPDDRDSGEGRRGRRPDHARRGRATRWSRHRRRRRLLGPALVAEHGRRGDPPRPVRRTRRGPPGGAACGRDAVGGVHRCRGGDRRRGAAPPRRPLRRPGRGGGRTADRQPGAARTWSAATTGAGRRSTSARTSRWSASAARCPTSRPPAWWPGPTWCAASAGSTRPSGSARTST